MIESAAARFVYISVVVRSQVKLALMQGGTIVLL